MSLQAYCSILYLKPRMQIILRGQKVKTQLVSKSLALIERDVYRPKFLVSFTFLFMMPYRDILIKNISLCPFSLYHDMDSNPPLQLCLYVLLDSKKKMK